jgi:hypothetical protein
MENLRKKNKTEIQNTMEVYSNRLEQEDRISELEDKMEIKEKTEEILVKQLKMCEKNIQELTNSNKRPTRESWTFKKAKRCKQKGFIIYSTT